jgi:phosphatidylinositol alpha-1,6-mannosyltransferase
MRVLLVTNDYPPKPGGIQQYLAGLTVALGSTVRVLAPRDHGSAPGEVFRDSRRFMWPTRRVRRWVEGHVAEFRPDIVVFGAPHPLAFIGPRLRRDTGVPYAVIVHGAEITLPAAFPIARQVVRWPLVRADLLLAISEFTSDRATRLTGKPVVVIGAGVDGSFGPRSDGAARSSDAVVIGCVSRFVPRKGQVRVLEACAGLRSNGRNIEVLLVGRGRDEMRLRRRADLWGIPTRFEVGVPFARLPELYREMDLFAMPCRSRWWGLEAEGFGVVFLEAAMSGLAVVAGDSGGSPETVDPGGTGFVVDTDRSLVEALRLLVDDPDLRRSMGTAGRQRAIERYSWSAVAHRCRAAFEQLAGDG